MCGIIGYTGNNNAKNVIISGLKNLEYRGYDSAGMAIFNNADVNLFKTKGRIENLEKLLKNENISTSCGIGHTRWATHGIPNEINAHPHQSGKVTLVHNGIIENYNTLKEFLQKEGVQFVSQTDSEVACAYINYVYEKTNDKLDSIITACKLFKGSYAFGILFDDEPDSIYFARFDSPLIIGTSDMGNFICSDINGILEYTNKYILVPSKGYGKITKNEIKLYDENQEELKYEIKETDLTNTNYNKNEFEHFMLKEIYEQPELIDSTFKSFFEKDIPNLDNIDFSKFSNIDIIACGSAMHAGLVGKYFLENYANIKTTVNIASEYRYNNKFFSNDTLVIVISQSGETADSLAALRAAKQHGLFVISIVNVPHSSIAREADMCIYTNAGPEVAVATTKGYTTQVAMLTILASKIACCKGDLRLYNLLKDSYKDFKNTLEEILKDNNSYVNIANKILNCPYLFFIGRGIDYAISMEGSLKLKEISYIHSESYAAGELKHGTISLIEEGVPVIAIATDKSVLEKTISNIKEVKSRGAYTILITSENLRKETTSDFADLIVTIKDKNSIINTLSVALIIQLIAYHTAKLKGCDIDKPKNLAKSVTVE